VSWAKSWGWAYVLATGLLLISIFSSWYSIRGGFGVCQNTDNFGLWLVQVSGCGEPAVSGSFSNFHLPLTGQLYFVALVLTLAGTLVLAAAAGLTFAKSKRGAIAPPFWAALAVTILALAAPTLVAFDQPNTVCADSESNSPPLNTPIGSAGPAWACTWEFYLGNGTWSGSGQSGPTTSFQGMATFFGDSLQWGPDLGWYRAYGAAIVALAPTFAAARYDWKGDSRKQKQAPA
jgi:hypothetical protein